MKEVWVPVKGFEGAYEVSNTGKVRSLTRTVKRRDGATSVFHGRTLKAADNGSGYLCVSLWKNRKEKRMSVHRLVALHFISDPQPGKETVNHKDGDKKNNHVSNLEWVSYTANNHHAIKTGLNNNVGENHYATKYSDRAIEEVRDLYDRGIFRQCELVELYKMSAAQVSLIVRRKTRTGRKTI